MADTHKSKFGAGLIVGTILGGLAAMFLSPKTGKEHREIVMKKYKELRRQMEEHEIDKKVKEIFGDITEEGTKLYKKARKELSKRLDDLKDKVEEFDHEKYIAIVNDVIEDVGKEMKNSPGITKLKDYLMKKWDHITEDQPEGKKTAKK